jgi:N-methylhydantoinase A/oxoprolinase/acetone carboxylase beta subunit
VQAGAATEFRRSSREVYVRGHGLVEAAVLHRSTLEPGESIGGPAVLEEGGSTTFVEPGMAVACTELGALVIETRAGA